MELFPTVDELAEAIADAMSAGQALDANALAAVAHAVIVRKRRAYNTHAKRRSRAKQREALDAQESLQQAA